MKRRIITVISTILLFSLIFSLTSCGSKEKYEFSAARTLPGYASVLDELNFVYEDTRLTIKENGKWKIDSSLFEMPFLSFIRYPISIDKGTYTVKDGEYIFEGFGIPSSWRAVGTKTDGGFEIVFSDTELDIKMYILYFKQ